MGFSGMSYSQAWLEHPASIRKLFAVINYYDLLASTEKTLYVSSVGYHTTDRSVYFEPIMSDDFSVSESLSLDGSVNISYSDIELSNPNGELDVYLDSNKYIWKNRNISVYLGDPQWTTTNISSFISDFHLIFSGVIDDIDSKNNTSLNIKIRDKLEKLNTPISEEKFPSYGTWPGGNPNLDTIIPLVFGEVFNIEPVLIDPANLEYQFNNGPSEAIIEVRDNGVPIYSNGSTGKSPAITTGLATIDLTTSTFTLAAPLAGTITMSVQGTKKHMNAGGTVVSSYSNNIAHIIGLIVAQYGRVGLTNLSAADIDLTSFSDFATDNPQPVGIYIKERDNVISVCQALANSVGGQIYFGRDGKLRFAKIYESIGGSTVTITAADMVHRSISMTNKLSVGAAVKIAYCKNWTVQEDLLTGIPEEHKKNFATEWYTKTAADSAVKSLYKVFDDPVQIETMLLTGTDAQDEADRRNNYETTSRAVYSFTGINRLLSLALGQNVIIIHNRFNLYNSGSGKSGQVISLAPDWKTATIRVDVVV